MKNFCEKCGTPLDAETRLCPNCDREQIEALAAQNTQEAEEAIPQQKYCEKCGADLDPQTGACTNPNCTDKTTMGTDAIFASDSAIVEKKDKTKKNKHTALTTTITILLSFVLFFTSICAVTIYDIRNVADEDNIEKLLDNIEASDIFATVKKSGNGKEIEDFYRDMEVEYGMEMDDDSLDDFINRSSAKEFLAEKMSDFGEDVFERGAELTIEKEEVIEFLEDNEREFEREFEVQLTQKMANKIADNFLEKNEVVIIDTRDLEDDIPVVYYAITIGLSYVTMAVLIALSGLIIFFMFKNSVLQAACGVGVVFITLGGLTAVIALLAAISSLWTAISGGSYIGIALGNFMAINALPAIIMLVLGIGLIVTRVIIKKHVAKKQSEEVIDELSDEVESV